MKTIKIILFILSFFILGALSANAATVTGSTPVVVNSVGTWAFTSSCPTICGIAQSTQTQTCIGGNCIGTAKTRKCNKTAECPCTTDCPNGTWSYTSSCPSCGVTSAFTQTQICTGVCTGTAQTRTCPANATCPVDLCPNDPGIQTTLPCPSTTDLCPNTPGVQTTLPCPVSNTTGTLTGDNCEIAKNGDTCTTTLTLGITNPVSGSATNITKPTNVEVATGITPASKTNIVVNYPSTTFYLNHNSNTLASRIVNAICVNGTGWDVTTSKCIEGGIDDKCPNIPGIQTTTDLCPGGGDDKCPNIPGIQTTLPCPSDEDKCPNIPGIQTTTALCPPGNELNITFTATPSKIFKGKSSVLTWTSTLGAKCMAVNGSEFGIFSTGTDSPHAGNTTVYPTKTTRYKISCTKGNITETDEVTVQVNFINIKEI